MRNRRQAHVGRSALALTAAFVICFIVSGASFVWLPWLGLVERSEDQIEFRPELLTSAKAVREYEVAQFKLTLANNSSRDAILRSVRASCGCLELTETSGHVLNFPTTISAETQLPLDLKVKTGGAIGEQEYRIWATLDYGGRELIKQSRVLIKVAAGIRAIPSYVRFDMETLTSTEPSQVILYDSYPDEGVSIARLETTKPELIHVRSDGIDQGNSAPLLEVYGLKPRHRITLSLTPEGRRVREEVSAALIILPSDKSHPVVQVPVVIRPPQSAIRFVPSSVVIPLQSIDSDSDRIVSRTVRCYMTSTLGELTVLSDIPGIESTLARTNDPAIWTLSIQTNLAKVRDLKAKKVVLQFSETLDLEYTVPVRFMALK